MYVYIYIKYRLQSLDCIHRAAGTVVIRVGDAEANIAALKAKFQSNQEVLRSVKEV